MKKILLVFVLLILTPKMLLAYEPGMLNLKTPTSLEKGQKEFKIQHRFYGKVNEEPLDNFFGTDKGVNVGINFRYTVWSKLELNVSRIWNEKEYTTGVSYAYSFPKASIRSQIDFQFFSYEEYNLEEERYERKSNLFSLFSLQSEPILMNRIIPVVNFGYDGHNRKIGVGLGTAIIAFKELGIIQRISVIGEFFPTTSDDESKNCFTFGLGFETYGHHFDFLLSNNSEIGIRRLMFGTERTEGLYLGFNIKRVL